MLQHCFYLRSGGPSHHHFDLTSEKLHALQSYLQVMFCIHLLGLPIFSSPFVFKCQQFILWGWSYLKNPIAYYACVGGIGSTSHSASLRSGSATGDSMGSTDTMTPSEVSTNVTLDTVSSHTCSSGSQSASCRALCGSLASFDTSSVLNTEGKRD